MATSDDTREPDLGSAPRRDGPPTPGGTKGFDPKRLIIPPGRGAPGTDRPAPPPVEPMRLEKNAPAPMRPSPAAPPPKLVLPKPPPVETPRKPPLLNLTGRPAPPPPATPPAPVKPLHLIPPDKFKPAAPMAAGAAPPPPAPQYRHRRRPTPSRRRLAWFAMPLAACAVLAFWGVDAWRSGRLFHPAAEESAPAVTPKQDAPTREVPTSPGQLRIDAVALTADGGRVALTNAVACTLRRARPLIALATGAVPPVLWQNLPAGDFALSATAPGYRPAAVQPVTVIPGETAAATLAFEPLPARVRFVCSDTNTVFVLFLGDRRLGTTSEIHELPPFVTHPLTFRAPGWRDAAVTLRLDTPGLVYRCRVATERIESGMVVSVVADSGAVPTTGLLSVNGSVPVRVALPLTRTALPHAGEVTLTLTLDGFTVLNNDQRVLLADRRTTNVVFRIRPNE